MSKSIYTEQEIRAMYSDKGLKRHNNGKFDEGVANAI